MPLNQANEREAAQQLEAMHTDAQRMLNQALADKGGRTDGLPLSVDDRRDAYRLSETQATARESQSFDESVDFTALMRDSRSDPAASAFIDDGDTLRRIDRDAVYEGKDGRPVAWKYTKPLRHIMVPPHVSEYAIYYGVTEIYCAEPTDCWLALGSDDHSKLWINDLLVWSSSKNLKTRNTGEGFRRVHFSQGVNRLLFRLENGWNGAEFSLLIRLE